MTFFATLGAPFVIGCDYHFSYDKKTRLMGGQAQHDQISICTVDTMGKVGFVGLWGTLLTDEFHDFMLALSWATGIREDDSEVFPEFVWLDSDFDVLADLKANIAEEGGAWGD